MMCPHSDPAGAAVCLVGMRASLTVSPVPPNGSICALSAVHQKTFLYFYYYTIGYHSSSSSIVVYDYRPVIV